MTHNEYIKRRDEIAWSALEGSTPDGTSFVIPDIQQAIDELVLAVDGEYEEPSAPINREIDGNPESDKHPDLYIVRRATRNIQRIKRVAIVKGGE